MTVLQLMGSLSPDTTQVIVTLQHMDTKIALKGTFIQTLGELTVTVPQPIQGGTALTLSFSLIHPSSAQIPNVPKVSIRLAASGIDLDPVEADSSSPCCLGAGGSHLSSIELGCSILAVT